MSSEPWQLGSIIQPRYLNSLQEMLSDYSDNVLLQASQSDVYVPATASAPAQLVVGGLMKTNLQEVSVSVSGAAGTYHVYAYSEKSSPTWGLLATPTQVAAPYTRKLGTIEFDGAEVSSSTSELREINVSHLLGHEPSEFSANQSIPAARADGTLVKDWFDSLDANAIPIGGIRKAWVPPGVSPPLPVGWRLLDGSTIPVASHSFPGVGPITLPDMRNRMSLGADTSTVYGAPGNSVGVAPGVNGVGGRLNVVDTSHNHGRLMGHTHAVATHRHSMTHRHFFEQHRHSFTGQYKKWPTSGSPADESYLVARDPDAGFVTRYDVRIGGDFNSQGSRDEMGAAVNVMSNDYTGNTGYSIATTSTITDGGDTTTVSAGNLSTRPLTIGMCYVMRVM